MAGRCLLATTVLLILSYSEALSQFLLFAEATNGRIIKIMNPTDSPTVASLALSSSQIEHPVALDYDPEEDRVYWTDARRLTISRCFRNGSSFEDIFRKNIKAPDGLAVDPVGRNLYWTDTGTNKLEVSKLNGSYRTVLIASGLDQPRDIILDVNEGIMYWTDWGSHPKIERAEMTGKQRIVLVGSGLGWPNGLTVDRGKHRLYWVDAQNDKLEYLDLNSNNRVTLIQYSLSLNHPFGLTLLDDHLYWTDWHSQTVFRANKETGGGITSFISVFGQPMDIHGYNLSEHTSQGSSSCQVNNGGCSHLCLLSSTGNECACSEYFSLKQDNKTCYFTFRKFLLFADAKQSELRIRSLDGSNSETRSVSIPAFNVSQPVALDVDLRDNRIYWTDIHLNTISRVFISGSSPEILANASSPEGLAIDPLGGNIYWTDTSVDKIEVSRLDGTMRKTLIDQNLDEPRDIILDLHKGLMYWCDWGFDHKVEVANMDGSNRRVLLDITTVYWPNGLTLDTKNSQLYWVDAYYQTLGGFDLIRNRTTLSMNLRSFVPLAHPFGLTLLENYLYWTDWSYNAVIRTETTPQTLYFFVHGLGNPMDIHAFDRNLSLPDHLCSLSYGGCSHLCLLRTDGYLCACPDHLLPGEICTSSSVAIAQSTSTSASSSTSTSVAPSTSPLLLQKTSPSVSSSSPPTASPSTSPLVSSSSSPSVSPSTTPTVFSSSSPPSVSPSSSPSVSPSSSPSVSPSSSPPVFPSSSPPVFPSSSPTMSPSTSPSVSPSATPPVSPSSSPPVSPSSSPPVFPSSSPPVSPSSSPPVFPSSSPPVFPSSSPPVSPSSSPPVFPSSSPPVFPSSSPPVSPSTSPSVSPSSSPSVSLSKSPSVSSASTSVVTSKAAVASVSTLALTSPLVLVSTLTATPSLLTSISVAASSLAPVSTPTFLAVTSLLPPPVTEVATTKPSSTLCRPGTCRNGGNCSIPGFVCRCKKKFAWYDCSVFLGFSAVEIILTLPGENQWNEFKFKVALSKACTMFFCRNDKCTSKSTKFGKVKRSDEATYFQPSDVIIIAFSFTAKTTLKVEFAVLLPSVEGQPPQVTPPADVVLMVDETKQSIQNDLGGTIESVSVKEDGNNERGISGESTGQKKSSVAPIAAGVGVGVVVVSALVAFALYRLIRRVRRLDSERNDADQLELRFQNPVYQAEPIYDSISSATGRSVVQNLSPGTDEIPSTNLSRMYDLPKPRYASPTGKTPDYACLHRTALPGQGSSESEKNKGNYGNDDEHYMKLTNYQNMIAYDESSNLPDEGDYLEPVDGHYRNAQRSERGKETAHCKNGKLREESQA